jgi:hypothetical protein
MNPQNRRDQTVPCVFIRSVGSRRKGKVRSPKSEPTFEMEYSLYVLEPPPRRANQHCSRGPVVERTKKGSPAETRMRTTTSRAGSPPAWGFHEPPGVIAEGQTKERPRTIRKCNKEQRKMDPGLCDLR